MDFDAFLRENRVKSGENSSLAQLLDLCTLAKLKEFAAKHELPNRSKMKKAELAAALAGVLADEEKLKTYYEQAGEKEKKLIEKLSAGACHMGDSDMQCERLIEQGYAFVAGEEDAFSLVMPTEIVKGFSPLFTKQEAAQKSAALKSPVSYDPPAQRSPQMPIRVTKIGRNQPCPCGSGKKYKKCCGR